MIANLLLFALAVIVSREITMSSLREWAATVSSEAYKAVAVGGWGKFKTASQVGLGITPSLYFLVKIESGSDLQCLLM